MWLRWHIQKQENFHEGYRHKKNDFPFRVKGVKMRTGDDWMARVVCGTHNHAPASYMEGHPYPGWLSESEIQLMAHLSMKNVKPQDIFTSLKKRNPNNMSTIGTIYNARQKFKGSKDVGEVSYKCGCRLRTSYRLPCAHEQAIYLNDGRPIPIDSIDKFWRKLDLSPCVSSR